MRQSIYMVNIIQSAVRVHENCHRTHTSFFIHLISVWHNYNYPLVLTLTYSRLPRSLLLRGFSYHTSYSPIYVSRINYCNPIFRTETLIKNNHPLCHLTSLLQISNSPDQFHASLQLYSVPLNLSTFEAAHHHIARYNICPRKLFYDHN